MRSTFNYRIDPSPNGTESQQGQSQGLTWLSAVAFGAILSVGLGCTSANRPQSTPFAASGPTVESATAGGAAIGSGVESVAAEDAAAVEDPQVAAAFARLAQARAEMAPQQRGVPASGISAQPGDSRLTDFDRAATMTARDQPWPSPEIAVPASAPAWTGTR